MDIEALLTTEQKADVVRSAILKAADGELSEDDFTVRYDRRFAHIFSVSNAKPVPKVIFSISPANAPPEFFAFSASEAARAIIDLREGLVDVVTQPRPSQMEVQCPRCNCSIRIVEG